MRCSKNFLIDVANSSCAPEVSAQRTPSVDGHLLVVPEVPLAMARPVDLMAATFLSQQMVVHPDFIVQSSPVLPDKASKEQTSPERAKEFLEHRFDHPHQELNSTQQEKFLKHLAETVPRQMLPNCHRRWQPGRQCSQNAQY